MLVEGLFGYWWRTGPGRWISLERMRDTHLLNTIKRLERRIRRFPDKWYLLLWIVRLESEARKRALIGAKVVSMKQEENPLFARFNVLTDWLMEKFTEAHMTMGLLEKELPAYHRAIREQITAMETAYFQDNIEGMKKAEENIKKFALRAAEQVVKKRKSEAA